MPVRERVLAAAQARSYPRGVLNKLIASVLRPEYTRDLIEGELQRLADGGYLRPEELQELTQECIQALGERVDQARATVVPLMQGVTATVREALDIPSRAEVLALTEALRAQQAKSED